MDPGLSALLFLLGLAIVAVVVSVGIRRLRIAMITRPSIDERTAEGLRAELLDYVKQNSFGEGYVVSLTPFWRRRGLTESDKHLVIDPLFNSNQLLVMKTHYGDSIGGMVQQAVESWTENVFRPMQEKVVLNPQVYQRMLLDGLSGQTIIGELRINAPSYRQSIDAGAGARVVASFQGDDAEVRQNVDQSDTGLSGAELERLAASLAAALKTDAEGIERDEARETALELAREAEQAAHSGDRNRVLSVLRRARDGIRMFGAGMEETRKVVEQFLHLLKAQ